MHSFPPPADKRWWRHLLWMLPLAAVIGLLLSKLRADRPAPERRAELPPAEQPQHTNPPPRVLDTNPPPLRPAPGQQVSNTNTSTSWREIGRSFPSTTNTPSPTDLARFPSRRIDWSSPRETNAPPASALSPKDSFELQLALDRRGFSPGNIDGMAGGQTAAAIRAFQSSQRLPLSGVLDPATKARLTFAPPAWTTRTLTTNDLARLLPLGKTWTEKSLQPRVDYETLLELVAEQHHTSQRLLQKENPGVVWEGLAAGAVVRVPNVAAPVPSGRAAQLRIRLSQNTLEALDEEGLVMMHFPCSIATKVERRPVGELHIVSIAPQPDYTFDPANFPDSPEAKRASGRLMIKPGPNNPVGSVWIGLDRPGYGIHGTPDPDKVGRTTSLGCFRLANWNAERLLSVVRTGMPVLVEP